MMTDHFPYSEVHGKSQVSDTPVPKGGLVLPTGVAASLSSLGIKQPIHDGVQQGLEKLGFPAQATALNN